MTHSKMRDWRGSNARQRNTPANKRLLQAIAERRELQRQLANEYHTRKAAEARAWRDGLEAGRLAAERNTQPTADTAASETPASRDMGGDDEHRVVG